MRNPPRNSKVSRKQNSIAQMILSYGSILKQAFTTSKGSVGMAIPRKVLMNAVTMRMSRATAQLETGNSLQIYIRAVKMRLTQFSDAEQFGVFDHRSPRQFVAAISV